MDTISTITNAFIALMISSLPHTWQLAVGFAIGCWFYRRMLRKDPQRLQSLVDLVNNSGDVAERALVKIEDVATSLIPPSKKP